MPTLTNLRAGSKLGPWTLGERLGSGAFGDVFAGELLVPVDGAMSRDAIVRAARNQTVMDICLVNQSLLSPIRTLRYNAVDLRIVVNAVGIDRTVAAGPEAGDWAIKVAPLEAKGKAKKKRKVNQSQEAILLWKERTAYVMNFMHGAPENIPRVPRQCSEDYDGFRFLVLQRLDCDLLRFRNDHGGSLPLDKVANIAVQLISGLQAVHEAGLLYLDVKPENFMLGQAGNKETVYLVDFGASTALRHFRGERPAARDDGTPKYLSRWVARGEPIAPRNDMESLAYVLVELSGRRLPWASSKSAAELNRSKESATLETICGAGGEPLREFLEHVWSLGIEEPIDYDALRAIWRPHACASLHGASRSSGPHSSSKRVDKPNGATVQAAPSSSTKRKRGASRATQRATARKPGKTRRHDGNDDTDESSGAPSPKPRGRRTRQPRKRAAKAPARPRGRRKAEPSSDSEVIELSGDDDDDDVDDMNDGDDDFAAPGGREERQRRGTGAPSRRGQPTPPRPNPGRGRRRRVALDGSPSTSPRAPSKRTRRAAANARKAHTTGDSDGDDGSSFQQSAPPSPPAKRIRVRRRGRLTRTKHRGRRGSSSSSSSSSNHNHSGAAEEGSDTGNGEGDGDGAHAASSDSASSSRVDEKKAAPSSRAAPHAAMTPQQSSRMSDLFQSPMVSGRSRKRQLARRRDLHLTPATASGRGQAAPSSESDSVQLLSDDDDFGNDDATPADTRRADHRGGARRDGRLQPAPTGASAGSLLRPCRVMRRRMHKVCARRMPLDYARKVARDAVEHRSKWRAEEIEAAIARRQAVSLPSSSSVAAAALNRTSQTAPVSDDNDDDDGQDSVTPSVDGSPMRRSSSATTPSSSAGSRQSVSPASLDQASRGSFLGTLSSWVSTGFGLFPSEQLEGEAGNDTSDDGEEEEEEREMHW